MLKRLSHHKYLPTTGLVKIAILSGDSRCIKLFNFYTGMTAYSDEFFSCTIIMSNSDDIHFQPLSLPRTLDVLQ